MHDKHLRKGDVQQRSQVHEARQQEQRQQEQRQQEARQHEARQQEARQQEARQQEQYERQLYEQQQQYQQQWQESQLPPLAVRRSQLPPANVAHDMQRLPMLAQAAGGMMMGAHALPPMWHPAVMAPPCYPMGPQQLYGHVPGLPPMLYAAPLMHAPSRQASDMLQVTSALLF